MSTSQDSVVVLGRTLSADTVGRLEAAGFSLDVTGGAASVARKSFSLERPGTGMFYDFTEGVGFADLIACLAEIEDGTVSERAPPALIYRKPGGGDTLRFGVFTEQAPLAAQILMSDVLPVDGVTNQLQVVEPELVSMMAAIEQRIVDLNDKPWPGDVEPPFQCHYDNDCDALFHNTRLSYVNAYQSSRIARMGMNFAEQLAQVTPGLGYQMRRTLPAPFRHAYVEQLHDLLDEGGGLAPEAGALLSVGEFDEQRTQPWTNWDMCLLEPVNGKGESFVTSPDILARAVARGFQFGDQIYKNSIQVPGFACKEQTILTSTPKEYPISLELMRGCVLYKKLMDTVKWFMAAPVERDAKDGIDLKPQAIFACALARIAGNGLQAGFNVLKREQVERDEWPDGESQSPVESSECGEFIDRWVTEGLTRARDPKNYPKGQAPLHVPSRMPFVVDEPVRKRLSIFDGGVGPEVS